jgi:prepilin-type N-terminal cleavage/methylation domain-containing protein
MIQRGFSFMEVLVCMVLISGSSLLLLKQCRQVHHTVQALCSATEAFMLQDNARERLA